MEASASAAPAPRPTAWQRLLGEHPTAWGFVLPALIIIVWLSIVPIVWSLLLSFRAADLIGPSHWVGLDNYSALVRDDALRESIKHTIVFTLGGGVGFSVIIYLAALEDVPPEVVDAASVDGARRGGIPDPLVLQQL